MLQFLGVVLSHLPCEIRVRPVLVHFIDFPSLESPGQFSQFSPDLIKLNQV